MTLNGVMAVILRYFTEFGKYAFQHITASMCGGIYARVYCILYHVYDVVVKKVHVGYLISWWTSCYCTNRWMDDVTLEQHIFIRW